LTEGNFDGVIIADLKWGAQVKWATAAHVLAAYTVAATPTAALPLAAGATAIDEDNAFTGWNGAPGTGLKTQFMYSFLDSTDDTESTMQDGSTVSVWTTLEVGPATANANVNTAAFVLVGAVQLTVAATSAIALALLF
jgi:hypothetical protein